MLNIVLLLVAAAPFLSATTILEEDRNIRALTQKLVDEINVRIVFC
jgi:hypothetical protein